MAIVRIYRKPQFNLTAQCWFNALPDDLTLWDGLAPSTPANVVFPCQLYYPRWGLNRWLHAFSDSCFRSLLNSGAQELRYDLGVDLKAPWGVASVSRWSDVPIVECPVASGRLYAVCLQEAKHLGFVNQYAIAILAQLGPIPPGPPPPPPSFRQWASGGAMRAIGSTSPYLASLGSGGAIESVAVFPPIPVDLASGSGLAALVVAGYAIVSGGALSARGSAGAFLGSLASGGALDAVTSGPTNFAGRLGSGGAIEDQELFPTGKRSIATGDGFASAKLPPGPSQSIASGGAIASDVGNLVKVNPCATIGAPRTILLACTSQTGTLTGFTGLSVTLTYNSGPNNWTGTLTRAGKSGTITGTSTGSGAFNFSGSSGLDWSVGANLSNDTVTCSPWGGTSGNHPTTAAGPQSGNTVWSYN